MDYVDGGGSEPPLLKMAMAFVPWSFSFTRPATSQLLFIRLMTYSSGSAFGTMQLDGSATRGLPSIQDHAIFDCEYVEHIRLGGSVRP